MLEQLDDPRIQQILSLDANEDDWRPDLERLLQGDAGLTRRSAGEGAIEAVQRMLVFLGYSTAASGAFLVDGDFGRGTNRGVAQFQFEHGLTRIRRGQLCYPCKWNTASREIVAIPEARLDLPTLEALLARALEAIAAEEVPLGRFDDALFHLNALHRGNHLNCRKIDARYGRAAEAAAKRVGAETDVEIQPEWILSIIRQETAGVVRPRFEQHILTRENKKNPRADLAELRFRSMSNGLGQIMGFNFRVVGAESARALVRSPIEDQVLYVARFVAQPTIASAVSRRDPTEKDFRRVAKFYNGPKYEAHAYHERLATWFREFTQLRAG